MSQPSEHVELKHTVERPALKTSPMARLARLHSEATETARLANLLGRSIHTAGALALMTCAAIALNGDTDSAKSIAWAVMVLAPAAVLWHLYARTMREAFQRPALKTFARNVSAVMLYAGFAWGAGAYLVLGGDASLGMTLAFSAGMGALVAVLLQEREAVFLFLAPVATLTAFASVLRPLPDGAIGAALVLISCALVAGGMEIVERMRARELAMPPMPDHA